MLVLDSEIRAQLSAYWCGMGLGTIGVWEKEMIYTFISNSEGVYHSLFSYPFCCFSYTTTKSWKLGAFTILLTPQFFYYFAISGENANISVHLFHNSNQIWISFHKFLANHQQEYNRWCKCMCGLFWLAWRISPNMEYISCFSFNVNLI